MQDTAVDKDHIPGVCREGLFIQRSLKAAGKDPYDLVFNMPVVGHHILGMRMVQVVKFKRKIIGAALFILVKVVILHKKYLRNFHITF